MYVNGLSEDELYALMSRVSMKKSIRMVYISDCKYEYWKGRGMKKISLEQLLEESRMESYPEQYRYICSQVESGKIMPVKSSPLNGKKPALPVSYWLLEEKPDDRLQIEELQFRTVPAIRTDYYLKHPESYLEERKWVRLLNRFFLEQNEADGERLSYVSLNERSFQIWGREKFLQREQGRKILAHCGVSLEQLCVYETTEPLAYYSHSRQVPQKILILENKDTFYTMRRYLLHDGGSAEMQNGGKTDGRSPAENINEYTFEYKHNNSKTSPRKMFGIEIGTVIYGAGKGILRSFEDFRFCVEPYINHPENEILYFGDLDYEGIGIYERLAELFAPEAPTGRDGRKVEKIKPFVQAYAKMLEKARAQGTDFLPEMSENQNSRLSGLFFGYFPDRMRDSMRQILHMGRYIPQEIINIADF